MDTHIDFKKLTTSWTKYDIVQVLDVIYSVETIEQYKNKEAKIDEPILRSFLGIKNLEDPIPDYWIDIQQYPKAKKIFALLALIFTHGGIVEDFATMYSMGDMKGVFTITEPGNKQLTNIRSALVVSKATDPSNRRKEIVPYDFSVALYNPKVGLLFKKVLQERISRLTEKELIEDEFYKVCYDNKFDKALSLTTEQFKLWLEGKAFEASYIKKIVIENFFSVKNQQLELGDSREIYFLGENGDGKTLFLMALYLAFNGNYIKSGILKTEEIGRAIDILNENHMVQGFDELNHEYNIDNAIHLDHFYAYGTHRGRYSPVKYEGNGFMTLFDNDLMLMSPEQWLKDLKLNEQKELIKVVIASNELEKILYDLLEKNVKIVIEGSEVFFEEKGAQLKFHQLSEGYRSIIIFVCDLLYRLSSNVKEDTNIFKSKGIVLVDEIDQHLHLKWQRVIVKKLREIFPNIQFFFTTHSPTIIQGASDDAIIYRVYREEGYTKVSDPYFRKDLDHLMMNTLVTSSLFGLEDSRMDADFNYANTDDTYLIYRINNKIKAKLEEQKESGKNFISDNEIDYIIDKILKEELGDEKNT